MIRYQKDFFCIQQAYLAGANVMTWFITKLLEILIFLFSQNVTLLHDKIHRFLVVTLQKELIKQLHDLPTAEVPKESQFLLDCILDELCSVMFLTNNTG